MPPPSPDNVTDRVRTLPFFRHLPLGDLERLLSEAELRAHPSGSTLLEVGAPVSHVHVLVSGRVSLRAALRSGEELTLAILEPGEWVGDCAALDRGPSLWRCQAEEPVLALRLSAFRLREWLDRLPEMGDWIRSQARRARQRDQALLAALGGKVEAHGATGPAPGDEAVARFVGSSGAARETRRAMRRAAGTPLPVLLVGETGTGKELVARSIHEASGLRGAFVPVNCGALQETLLESELFGHQRGAFTGASRDKAGLVDAARGGTLFLDEIEEMSGRLQAVLLRFLEDGEYRAVGATKTGRSDARIIAACQHPPERMEAPRRLREDLRYRLDVIRIPLPPLRSRAEDVPLLCQELMERVAARLGVPRRSVEREALERLTAAAWPGNVRELRNEVERWFALPAGNGTIGPEQLSVRIPAGVSENTQSMSRYGAAVRAFKTQLVREALQAAGGNKSRAAADLGLHRSNFSRLARELGVD